MLITTRSIFMCYRNGQDMVIFSATFPAPICQILGGWLGLRLPLLDGRLAVLEPPADLVPASREALSREPSNKKLPFVGSSCGLLRSTISNASLSVAPLSSKAVRNRASSLHNSQSPSFFALARSRTSCSELELNSSNVCKTRR